MSKCKVVIPKHLIKETKRKMNEHKDTDLLVKNIADTISKYY